jgi:phosphatidylinositol alpha 1,6-mannosyltransferase
VVAPASGGPLDLVRPGDNGLLYPPGDTSALRGCVTTLTADAALRVRMGERAHRSVRDRTWDVICDELIGHYRSVAALPLRSAA